MKNIIKYENIESKIIDLREQKVLLDKDVADIYGIETKRVNEAVKNNTDRFPDGYVIEITDGEKNELVENFDRFKKLKHSSVTPKAFTEKGLYMLATILKSKTATQTTIAIIETFAKVRELTKTIKTLSQNPEKEKQKNLMQKSGEIISELLDNDLQTSESETTIELNFAVLKFKHSIKKKDK
ncbi:MAG: ORF6N domain-containing protein [Bacteroidales bacterium]|nr:ORF6N domain-containing protein [Bacteroidales bacterium]